MFDNVRQRRQAERNMAFDNTTMTPMRISSLLWCLMAIILFVVFVTFGFAVASFVVSLQARAQLATLLNDLPPTNVL